jgi:hypothetical protein
MVSSALVIALGDISACFRVGSLTPAFRSQLEGRYAPFLVSAGDIDPLMVIDLTFVACGEATDRDRQMREHPLVVATDLSEPSAQISRFSRFSVNRWDLEAQLHRDEAGRWHGQARCEENPHSFDTLLRVIWSVLLPHYGGAILHACGIRNDGAGLVFPGVSERGKTTLARKVPDPDDVLSDELVIVRTLRPGQWRAYGTPFWGDFERGGVSRDGLPLAAIAFLEQAPALAVLPVSPAAAALRLLGCWLGFETDSGAARRNLALAVRLASETPIVEVHSRRETPVAAIVDRLNAQPAVLSDFARANSAEAGAR